MPEAADAVVQRLDLIVHVVGSAGKAGAAFDQLLDRRGGLFDRIAVPVPDKTAALAARLERREVGGKRVVAVRVFEWLGLDRRGADIIGGKVGAAEALLARPPDPDDRGVGETVGACGPTKLLRSLAIGLEHWARGRQRQQ